jgi:pimeloyl-ACP methyl ester carboxylesterase
MMANTKLSAFTAQVLIVVLLLVTSCAGQTQQPRTEEIIFQSGSFKVVGDLRLPEGRGPHPVVVFVHGDGPNDRTSGVTYPPIMERMLRVGYATFAWDKPGTGESTGQIDRSRLVEQRAQIVLDAIAVLKEHPDIDSLQIGLWGISQAGYVMPRVLSMSEDVAFMIAVSCPGAVGADQGAYLVASQAACAGMAVEDVERVTFLIGAVSKAQTYDEYVKYKTLLADYPALSAVTQLGFKAGVMPEEYWHAEDLQSEYYAFDPMEIIERTTIPVLAFFGERDTAVDPIQGAQAYQVALERAGNPNSRVVLVPDTNHNITYTRTGCLNEWRLMSETARTNYAPGYLDTLEEWLGELRR